MKKHLVFVYGTLRPPYGNYQHYLKNDSSTHLGRCQTKERLFMFASGIPYVSRDTLFTEEEKEIHTPIEIQGDLFEVNDDVLSALDHLEGHPNFYTRTPLQIIKENGEEVTAEIYYHDVSKINHLHYVSSGSYHDYKGNPQLEIKFEIIS